MSIAIAHARHIFGLKPGVAGNICFHDEQTVVYPAGANCILYNIDQKSQKFIPGTKLHIMLQLKLTFLDLVIMCMLLYLFPKQRQVCLSSLYCFYLQWS